MPQTGPILKEEKIRQYIEKIDRRLGDTDLNGWQMTFLDDIRIQLVQKRRLSEKQELKLWNLIGYSDQ